MNWKGSISVLYIQKSKLKNCEIYEIQRTKKKKEQIRAMVGVLLVSIDRAYFVVSIEIHLKQ